MLAGIIGSRSEQGIKIVKSTVGYYLFFYYQYKEFYSSAPTTLDDMINGLLYIKALDKLKELK